MTRQPGAGAGTRWRPGDVVALRYITTRDGGVGTTWPCRVVCDRGDLLALFIPGGAVYKQWTPHWASPNRHLGDHHWPGDVVRLMFPGRWYSIWVFLQAGDGTRRFNGYYVNFEEPFRRSAIGFDTNDHTLDIVVTPELTWSWKDAEDFEARVRDGIYSPAFAAAVRAEADRVIAAIEARRSPFSDGWDRWVPDRSWTVPDLPPTWDTEPVTLWERRRWAYRQQRTDRGRGPHAAGGAPDANRSLGDGVLPSGLRLFSAHLVNHAGCPSVTPPSPFAYVRGKPRRFNS